jgi:predicted RNA-binding Zn ribbon-like protein
MGAQVADADQSATKSDFLFIGGDLSIDLVNTEMMVAGDLLDRIGTPAQLAAWVAESELGPRARSGAGTGAVLDIPAPVFRRVVALRAVLRAGFDEIALGREPSAATVESINEVLREEPGSRLRVTETGGLERVSRVEIVRAPKWLPWLFADAAANLLSGPEAGRLRRCANHVCVLYFVDTSRNRSRRWCSMDLCGNRSKVSAHHQRARGRTITPKSEG